MIIVMTIGFIILMACIVAVAVYLNKKIDALDEAVHWYINTKIDGVDERVDALDEAVFRYMKDEHNAKVNVNE